MKLFDIMTAPWAITRDVLTEIQMVYEAHMKGEKIDLKALEARMGFPFQPTGQVNYEVINEKAFRSLTNDLARSNAISLTSEVLKGFKSIKVI